MHIALIGRTGSGKSTLAAALCEEFSLHLISSSTIAFQLAENDTATQLALQQGDMAPEQSMRAAIRAEIEAADVQYGSWILDGFPRSVEQLVCLNQWSNTMPVFIHLDAPAWTCIERLCSRSRRDDNPNSIARKMRHWETEVAPMLRVLTEGGVLTTVNAALPTPQQIENVKRSL